VVSVASELVSPSDRERAFERLFETEYSRVTAIAYRVLGTAPEAEDVAQEAFCQFYRLHDPRARYARPWLYRAATHLALNAVRGNKRRTEREKAAERLDERASITGPHGTDPSLTFEQTENVEVLREAMSRLPRKSAAILALRYSGLSYAEVADALGTSVGQVGTRLRRAEQALRKEMNDDTSV
jgi:RNA polymerase sigma factor (sigma-70 family)